MWINFILHVSSAIHRIKEKVIVASVIKTIGLSLAVIFLELFLFIISLPLYLFVVPDKFSQDKKEIEKYRLKRKVSLVGIFLLVVLVLVVVVVNFALIRTTPIKTNGKAEAAKAIDKVAPIKINADSGKESSIIADIMEAAESPDLSSPVVDRVAGTNIRNDINFSGSAASGTKVVLFIQSEPAVVYETQADGNGDWSLSHSQNDIELADGEYEVYALAFDADRQVKSNPGKTRKFTVAKNLLARTLLYFDLRTILLTILVVLLGMVVLLIRKNRAARKIKQAK